MKVYNVTVPVTTLVTVDVVARNAAEAESRGRKRLDDTVQLALLVHASLVTHPPKFEWGDVVVREDAE